MSLRGRLSTLGLTAVLFAACSGGSASPAPVSQAPASQAPASVAPSMAPSEPASMAPSEPPASAAPIPGGLLDKVLKAGTVIVSTDANYAPQSIQKADGTYEGFDIETANEIAKRLGVKVEYITPDWAIITAGGWGGRWDMSVGSMTVTSDRQKVLSFSTPYYFTPAQMTASVKSGITTIEGLAGKTVCAGESTTYLDWLQGKKLDFGTLSPTTTPPAGVTAVTQKTDQQCPQLWASGRFDFEGWISSSTTVDAAMAAGMPLVKVGDPVYYEPLAAAMDLSGPDPTDFTARVSEIIQAMHDDGTLKASSEKWLGGDLTEGPTP